MAKRKNRQRNQLRIVAGVMSSLAAVVVVAAVLALRDQPAGDKRAKQPTKPAPSQAADSTLADNEPAPPDPQADSPPLIDDDGRTLWASPTGGDPIALDWLPPDCQLVLHLRPAAMADDEQAALAARSLGPSGGRLWHAAEEAIGQRLDGCESVTIGVRPGAGGTLEPTFVVKSKTPAPVTGREATHAGAAYRVRGGWCSYAINGGRRVVATRPAMHEVLDAGGEPPPLRREVEQLAAFTDAQRHATLLVAPSFLFTSGKSLLSGPTAALRGPLFAETPDDLRAALVSLHWSDDRFYWELRGAPAADTAAGLLARGFEQRIGRWPGEVQLAVLDARPAPHGRRVVAQLPLMLGALAKHARRGVVGRHAVVNGYLPAAAGHNLLLAAELLAAQLSAGRQSAGGVAAAGAAVDSSPPPAAGLAEKLVKNVTVSFRRDTLEQALRVLSEEMGAPIVILGGDLKLEGITKNQSFGIDARDQPAERVLLEILALANPDRTASGPQDPKQKLVYVVRKEPTGVRAISITTRSAAAARGERLPPAFGR